MALKIVAISDTHNDHNELDIPECDILIHAGDATGKGYEYEVKRFAKWFQAQPARHKIFVPGNHELYFDHLLPNSKSWFNDNCPDGHLLIDQTIEIEGVVIHGSPVQPWFFDWGFNRARNYGESIQRHIKEIKPHWDMIPNNVDILVTHGGPRGILDYAPRGGHVGCDELLARVKVVTPDLHFFGHIHEGYGQHHENGTNFYNVAICDGYYQPINPITVVEYE